MDIREPLKNLNAGHRKRLRERFMQSGFDGFLDYEIVELLLTFGTPLLEFNPQPVPLPTRRGQEQIGHAGLHTGAFEHHAHDRIT
jgi:hypothetical protein